MEAITSLRDRSNSCSFIKEGLRSMLWKKIIFKGEILFSEWETGPKQCLTEHSEIVSSIWRLSAWKGGLQTSCLKYYILILTRAEVRFGILFYVFIAQMNPRFLKVPLVDQVFITWRSEKACGIFNLAQILPDFPVREVLPGRATGTREFSGSKETQFLMTSLWPVFRLWPGRYKMLQNNIKGSVVITKKHPADLHVALT